MTAAARPIASGDNARYRPLRDPCRSLPRHAAAVPPRPAALATFRSRSSRAATSSRASTRVGRRRRPPRPAAVRRRRSRRSLTMTRSALKPFQAMPFVAAGGVERFGYSRRAGGAALREPFRRAAARRGRGRHAGARRQRRRGPAVRHARARASTRCAARCRRRRRTRRSRTTARASTAGCSRYCVQCGLPQARLPRLRPSAAAGDPARGRAFHGDAGGRARRRHRRLLGAELRGAARAARARRLRGSPRATTTPTTAARRGSWPTR